MHDQSDKGGSRKRILFRRGSTDREDCLESAEADVPAYHSHDPEPDQCVRQIHHDEVGIFANDPDEGEILYAIAIAETDQWDYMPAYNDLLPSTITVDFLTEVANADEVVITTPNQTYLYDQTTGDKYVLGVDNGLLYFEEVEGA